jgi:hypothetical protein
VMKTYQTFSAIKKLYSKKLGIELLLHNFKRWWG